jgi:hypothetical protein
VKRSLLVLAAALVVAAPLALAAAEPVTVLPRPRFNAPAGEPNASGVRFVLVSSRTVDPGRLLEQPRPARLRIDGDRVIAPGRYGFDFRNYVWPPRIAPGEREFVDERVVWAREAPAGILFVETAHSTYARSSYGLNAYLNAIDVKRKKLLWRSPALVANADNFVVLNEVIVSGYGFTAEPDYLYALSRETGRVVARLLIPSAPERIIRRGGTLYVKTYDHDLVVRVVGG